MAVQTQLRARIQSGMHCDATGGAERHRLSDFDSPFVLRPSSAVLSSVLAVLFVGASSAMQARIINAASPSLADVRGAIASAADGDTVIVPAGTASWTSALTIKKGITIQGQTTVDSDSGTADDKTVLVDNLARIPGGQGDRKSTRLNSSHTVISYAVFCLKKKKSVTMRLATDEVNPRPTRDVQGRVYTKVARGLAELQVAHRTGAYTHLAASAAARMSSLL